MRECVCILYAVTFSVRTSSTEPAPAQESEQKDDSIPPIYFTTGSSEGSIRSSVRSSGKPASVYETVGGPYVHLTQPGSLLLPDVELNSTYASVDDTVRRNSPFTTPGRSKAPSAFYQYEDVEPDSAYSTIDDAVTSMPSLSNYQEHMHSTAQAVEGEYTWNNPLYGDTRHSVSKENAQSPRADDEGMTAARPESHHKPRYQMM